MHQGRPDRQPATGVKPGRIAPSSPGASPPTTSPPGAVLDNPSHCIDNVTINPTVDQVLKQTDVGNGLHQWATNGGVIRVTRDELRPALEAAYDETMPNWPAMVEIEDA